MRSPDSEFYFEAAYLVVTLMKVLFSGTQVVCL
jgi:hypothetical protein